MYEATEMTVAAEAPNAASSSEVIERRPPFERTRSRGRHEHGFDALNKKLAEAARMTHRTMKLAMPAAAHAYDRWERRHSVAACGDRLSLLHAALPALAGGRRRRGGGGGATRQQPLVDEELTGDASSAEPAVVGFESYEYGSYGSQLRFEAEEAEAARVDHDKLAELLLRGFVPLTLGVLVGALAWVSHRLGAALIRLKWSWVLSLVNAGSERDRWSWVVGVGGVAAAYPVFVLFCMTLTGSAAALTVYGAPAAAGSGIPMVKAELNGVRVPGALSAATLAVKLVGVTLVVASGLPCGREGPMVQLGAGAACIVLRAHNRILSAGWCRSARAQARVIEEDRDVRDFVSMGAAAGVAAAFDAPIGGVLFALEEVS